jgi:hypothetical protein
VGGQLVESFVPGAGPLPAEPPLLRLAEGARREGGHPGAGLDAEDRAAGPPGTAGLRCRCRSGREGSAIGRFARHVVAIAALGGTPNGETLCRNFGGEMDTTPSRTVRRWHSCPPTAKPPPGHQTRASWCCRAGYSEIKLAALDPLDELGPCLAADG